MKKILINRVKREYIENENDDDAAEEGNYYLII
jgi:hypothetical protein